MIRFLLCCVSNLLIILFSSTAFSQGAPNIIWSQAAHTNSVESIAFSSDGQKVVSSGGQEVKLWQASDGMLLQTISGFPSDVESIDLAHNNIHLAAGYIVGTYPPGGVNSVRDINQGIELYSFGGSYVKFSPNGGIIASGGGGVNRYLTLHSISDGSQIGSYYNGPGYITDIEFSPDGQIVAVSNTRNEVKLWDISSGTVIRTLTGHTDDVRCITFSPDGQMLAGGAGGWDDPNDATIKLWQVSDGSLVNTLPGHGDWVSDVVFSPDGQLLLSSGRDGLYPNVNSKIKIWRIYDGLLLQYYDQEVNNGAQSLDVSPDGQVFCYGRGDGMVVVATIPNVTGIKDNISELVPGTVQLYQNFPNPFNPTTQIKFSIPEATQVKLEIFNMLGERVNVLVNQLVTAGEHTIQWNASQVPSGIYAYRLTAGSHIKSMKMVLLR